MLCKCYGCVPRTERQGCEIQDARWRMSRKALRLQCTTIGRNRLLRKVPPALYRHIPPFKKGKGSKFGVQSSKLGKSARGLAHSTTLSRGTTRWHSPFLTFPHLFFGGGQGIVSACRGIGEGGQTLLNAYLHLITLNNAWEGEIFYVDRE